MVICLKRGADLHTAQLIPLPLTVSCFGKVQTDFTFMVLFWYRLTQIVLEKGTLNRCVKNSSLWQQQYIMITHSKWMHVIENRDVNETRESRVSIFFLDPWKEFLDFRESRLKTARQQAYSEWNNCHLSLCACYQSIACLLHRGRGPHTRRTDAAKQRTVAYLSGRGEWAQMFLLPGADNPSYATALARQCKCGCFSLHV